jgi:hypothetical protein
MSGPLVSAIDSMSKSRWLTPNVVTTFSICAAAAPAEEQVLPRSVPPLSVVHPPKEMITSPPAERRALIWLCQLEVLYIDHWQPAPSTNASVKNLSPVALATLVSVVLLNPAST